jgi:hypothetical protein
MGTLILILLFAAFCCACYWVIIKQGRKNFRLRNLQLKNAEMQNQQYMNQQQPQQQMPGWYPDGNGGQKYWDGRAWTAASTQGPTPEPMR